MQTLWFILVGFMLTMYVVLEQACKGTPAAK